MISELCKTDEAVVIAEAIETRVRVQLGEDRVEQRLLAMQCALMCELIAELRLSRLVVE
jgi:hypothetical protein